MGRTMNKGRESKNLIVGLDIGTSKIVVIVGEIKSEGTLEVVGVGMHESSGMKKGMVVNIDATVSAIQRALGEFGQRFAVEIGIPVFEGAGEFVTETVKLFEKFFVYVAGFNFL